MPDDIYYDAFISYSSKTHDFVSKLREALEDAGQNIWQDHTDLVATGTWWAQIKSGILAADNFVFVLSQLALESPICQLELGYARELNKRIVILRYQDAEQDKALNGMVGRILGEATVQEMIEGKDMFGLAADNWNFIADEQNVVIRSIDDLPDTLPILLEIFQTDFRLKRQGTILLGRANEWLKNDKNPSFLLVGEPLRSAEKWLAAPKKDTPDDQHRDFIHASLKAEAENERSQRRARRTVRFAVTTMGCATVATLLTLCSLFFTFALAGEADDQLIAAETKVAIAETQQLVGAQTAVSASVNADIAATELAVSSEILEDLEERVVEFNATATQSAIVVEINDAFSNALLSSAEVYSLSLMSLNDLVERFPTQARAFYARGWIRANMGDTEGAFEDFDRAIELDPDFKLAYVDRAAVFASTEDYEAALRDLNKAIELDPEYVEAYNARGISREVLGDIDGAIEDYQRAIELNENYFIAYSNLGTLYYDLSDYDRAIEYLSQALEIDETYLSARWWRAFTYLETNQFDAAIVDFDFYIGNAPLDSDGYLYRALTYFYMDEPQLALTDFDSVIDLTGSIPDFVQEIYESVVDATDPSN